MKTYRYKNPTVRAEQVPEDEERRFKNEAGEMETIRGGSWLIVTEGVKHQMENEPFLKTYEPADKPVYREPARDVTAHAAAATIPVAEAKPIVLTNEATPEAPAGIPAMVYTGTGWVRNPALPPPEPLPANPVKPGFHGGCFVPPALNTPPPPPPPVPPQKPAEGFIPSPTMRTAPQTQVFSPFQLPMPPAPAQAAVAMMEANNSAQRPQVALDGPMEFEVPPLPVLAAPGSATMLAPAAPPPVAVDPIQEQINKAKAMAGGKM